MPLLYIWLSAEQHECCSCGKHGDGMLGYLEQVLQDEPIFGGGHYNATKQGEPVCKSYLNSIAQRYCGGIRDADGRLPG